MNRILTEREKELIFDSVVCHTAIKTALLRYQKRIDSSIKKMWNAIAIGPKKAQVAAKSVMENKPKIGVMTASYCCIRKALEKATPKLNAVKKI